MAGLQYNLFPTDFFYPRPISVAGQNSTTSLPMLQVQKRSTDGVADHHDVKHPSSSLVLRNNNSATVSAVVNKMM
ncbi:hypothetical protein LINGRAHAP2_LOCUS25053 [Linum grandiflorum]